MLWMTLFPSRLALWPWCLSCLSSWETSWWEPSCCHWSIYLRRGQTCISRQDCTRDALLLVKIPYRFGDWLQQHGVLTCCVQGTDDEANETSCAVPIASPSKPSTTVVGVPKKQRDCNCITNVAWEFNIYHMQLDRAVSCICPTVELANRGIAPIPSKIDLQTQRGTIAATPTIATRCSQFIIRAINRWNDCRFLAVGDVPKLHQRTQEIDNRTSHEHLCWGCHQSLAVQWEGLVALWAWLNPVPKTRPRLAVAIKEREECYLTQRDHPFWFLFDPNKYEGRIRLKISRYALFPRCWWMC